ncbi:MAG: hypothetical protein HY428_01415 [Candidatus Levybacteria bacterium]|nr:hypothetical protein [Candidatus Levybacteria bacterium]
MALERVGYSQDISVHEHASFREVPVQRLGESLPFHPPLPSIAPLMPLSETIPLKQDTTVTIPTLEERLAEAVVAHAAELGRPLTAREQIADVIVPEVLAAYPKRRFSPTKIGMQIGVSRQRVFQILEEIAATNPGMKILGRNETPEEKAALAQDICYLAAHGKGAEEIAFELGVPVSGVVKVLHPKNSSRREINNPRRNYNLRGVIGHMRLHQRLGDHEIFEILSKRYKNRIPDLTEAEITAIIGDLTKENPAYRLRKSRLNEIRGEASSVEIVNLAERA